MNRSAGPAHRLHEHLHEQRLVGVEGDRGVRLLGAARPPIDDRPPDSQLALGLDVRIGTPLTFNRQNLYVGTHAIGYWYPVSFTVESFEPERVKTSAELEFGLAIGGDPLWTVFGFDINRLGLAYRFSDETRAVILNTRFPF